MNASESTTRSFIPTNPPAERSESRASATRSTVAPASGSLVRLQRAVTATLVALLLLAGVRLSFVTGLWTPVTIDGPSMAPALLGLRYELVCGECRMAFSRDATQLDDSTRAVCPNCGYGGNRLSASQLRPGERVLIDRWPHLWRPPQRGEIVAAALQPDLSGDLVVKRIAAAGPADLTIRDGDLFLDGQIVWRSIHEIREVRQLIHDNDFQPPPGADLPPRWQPVREESAWQAAGTRFRATAARDSSEELDWLQYHHWMCTPVPTGRVQDAAVRDYDPYNAAGERELNAVRDLVLTCRVAAAGNGRFAFSALDGGDRFEAIFEPGRGVKIVRNDELLEEVPLRLNFARRAVELEFGLCDEQVLLIVSGRTLVRRKYERPEGPYRDVLYPLAIGTSGLNIDVANVRVWRDIYYLEPRKTPRDWAAAEPLAAGHYLLLGDNQPASLDSRAWEAGIPRSAILGRVYRPVWQQR